MEQTIPQLSPDANPRQNRARLALGLWFLAVLALVTVSPPARWPIGVLPVYLATSTFAIGLFVWLTASGRQWALTVPLKTSVGVHFVRAIIGAGFVFEASQGRLPHSFSDPVGWGDVVVGVLAVPMALALTNSSPTGARRMALLLWNAFALLDILNAQRLGAWHTLHAPDSLIAFAHLPYALVPTFFVPLVTLSHLLIFYRLGKGH